jgi:hypothetical protein
MELAILTTLCLSRPEAPAAGLAWMQLNIAPAVALPLLALLLRACPRAPAAAQHRARDRRR